MRKMTKFSAMAAAVMMSVVMTTGAPAEAASYSSSNVTLVNANKTTSKKAVSKVEITSPAIKAAKLTIYRGTSNVSVQLKTKVTVTGKGITSATKKYNAVSYKSSNPTVVSVSTTGKLTAKKTGSAKITVTSAADSKKKATVTVTVKPGVGAIKATVSKKTSVTLTSGKTAKISTTLSKVAKGASKAVTYTSSNTKVATVSSTGVITANKTGVAGTATITVAPKYGTGVKATIKVTVPAVLPTKITPKATSVTLVQGGTTVLGYTLAPSNATNKAVKFTSNATKIAEVDSKGKVTAVAPGTATITITSKANSKVKATVKVTVKAVLPTSIKAAISYPNSSFFVGQSRTITAAVSPSNTTNKAVKYQVIAGTNVVTVTTAGTVTARSAGTATIRVSAAANTKVYQDIKVTVKDWEICKVDTMDVVSGNSYDLPLGVAQSAVLSYETDNKEIATAANGKVIAGNKRGTATITITAKVGALTRKTTVLVTVIPKSTKVTFASEFLNKTEVNVARTITWSNTATLVEQLNQAIANNKQAITEAGIQPFAQKVTVDGIEYIVKFDGTKITVLRDGKEVTLTNDKKTVNHISMKLPEGRTVGSLLEKYASAFEQVQGLVKTTTFSLHATVGTFAVTKVGFEQGYIVATINGTEYQGFLKEGDFYVVGDVTKSEIVEKLMKNNMVSDVDYIKK